MQPKLKRDFTLRIRTHPNSFSRHQTIGAALIVSSLLSFTAYAQVINPVAGELGYRTASSGIATCSPQMSPDISTSGTDLNLSDDGEANVVLPFLFDFYGVRSNKLRIGNNGGINFDSTSDNLSPINADFVDTGSPSTPRILPFWDDLDSEQGGVYYQTVGTTPNRVFVIQWKDRPHFSGQSNLNPVTIQAELYESSNVIAFFYPDMDFANAQYDNGASASVGLISNTGKFTKTSFNSDLTAILPRDADSGIYYECYEPSHIKLETWLTRDYDHGDSGALSAACFTRNNPKLKTLTLDVGSNYFGMCFVATNTTDQAFSRHDLVVTHASQILNNTPYQAPVDVELSVSYEIDVNELSETTVEYIATWGMHDPAPADTYMGTDTTTVKYTDSFLLNLIPAIIAKRKE